MKKYKKALSALFAALMATAPLLPVVSAEEAAEDPYADITVPSGIDITTLRREIDDLITGSDRDNTDFASAEIGVFVGKDVVYTGYYGYTDAENGILADENSVYEWGSITKTFIWVSAMQLWEQGKLDLDRDIREYLPDDFFGHLSYDDPITMLNLMDHNAGWQETTRGVMSSPGKAIPTLEDALKAIEPAQIHRPGEVTAYSNYGAAVAGYVVECISGMSFCDYVHQNIFAPLGMEHTAILPDHSDNAYVYDKRKGNKSYRMLLSTRICLGDSLYYVDAYPAGAATGTLADLMTYAQALCDDDAPLFADKATQELMFTATDHYGDSDIPLNAHGFWTNEYKVRTYGHDGATYAGQAYMNFDPVSKTGLVIMVNEPDGNVFLSETPTLVFGSLEPDKYGKNSVQEKLTGYYLPARSTFKGMMRFVPYLSAIDISKLDRIENNGDGVHQIVAETRKPFSDDSEESVMLLGERHHPDGTLGFASSGTDLLYDGAYLVELILLTVFIMLGVVSVFIFMIELKLKKHNRLPAYTGHKALMAGHIARLVSVLLMLSVYVVFSKEKGGLPYNAGAVIGIAQIICMAVCAVTAVISILIPVMKKEKPLKYIMSTAGNALCITAVLYFQMYVYWDI